MCARILQRKIVNAHLTRPLARRRSEVNVCIYTIVYTRRGLAVRKRTRYYLCIYIGTRVESRRAVFRHAVESVQDGSGTLSVGTQPFHRSQVCTNRTPRTDFEIVRVIVIHITYTVSWNEPTSYTRVR